MYSNIFCANDKWKKRKEIQFGMKVENGGLFAGTFIDLIVKYVLLQVPSL